MAKKSAPARRIISALDELVAFVKSKYWETDRDHYMDDNERRQLADLEGRLIALLSQDGRIPFPPNHPSTQRNDASHIFYTPLTGVMYMFIGPGTQLDRDDHWELKMAGLRAAVQTLAEAEEAQAGDATGKGKAEKRTGKPKPLPIPADFKKPVAHWPKFKAEMDTAGKRPVMSKFAEWLRTRHGIGLDAKRFAKWFKVYSRSNSRRKQTATS